MIDVDDEFTGIVIEAVGPQSRLKAWPVGRARPISLMSPSRSLIGYQGGSDRHPRSGVTAFSHMSLPRAIDAGRRACWSQLDGETAPSRCGIEDRVSFVGAGEKPTRA